MSQNVLGRLCALKNSCDDLCVGDNWFATSVQAKWDVNGEQKDESFHQPNQEMNEEEEKIDIGF